MTKTKEKEVPLEEIGLPGAIVITDDMLPSLKEEALKHNASLARIKEQRSLPIKEQIRRAFEWDDQMREATYTK